MKPENVFNKISITERTYAADLLHNLVSVKEKILKFATVAFPRKICPGT